MQATQSPDNEEIPFSPEERAYLESLAINMALAEKQMHAAVGMLAITKGAGKDWELKPDRSGFLVTKHVE